jgi:hypothetical protein
MIAQAESVQKTVAVTEPNWQALIASLKIVTETEAQILDQLMLLAKDQELQTSLEEIWRKLAVLVTRGELQGILNRQVKTLTQQQKLTTEVMESYRQEILTATEEAQKNIASMTTSTEVRFGQMREKFSNAISDEQQSLRKWMLRYLLISAIPSLLLVILELILHLC